MSFCLFVLFAILDYMSIVEMNKKEKLSPHFTLGEMTKTKHKTEDGNIPSRVAIENLKRLCGWLEMLREEWNKRYGEGNDPIIINSAYRSWEVRSKLFAMLLSCSISQMSHARTLMN